MAGGPLDLRGRVIIQDAGATSTLRRIQGALTAVAGAARNPTNSLGSLGRNARNLGANAGGLGSFGSTFASAYFLKQQFDFEKALNRTQAILDITNKQSFKPLRDEIVRLAETYPAMRKEVAEGATELAMAGMKMDTVKNVLEGTVQGAMASGESMAIVGAGVTDVIMSMALPFKTAEDQMKSFALVNDKLAAGATSYNQNYTQFLSGLSKTGPVARAAGVELHDVVAMLGTLANAGIKAERGGTGLSTLMLRIGSPTKKARGEIARLFGDVDRFYSKFRRDTSKFSSLGADPLVEMLTEELGLGDAAGLTDSINQVLADTSKTGNAGNLSNVLTELITGGLGVDGGDAENRAKVQDVVSRYVRGTFSTLDFLGIAREFAMKDADKSLSFLNEVAGKHHAAKYAALLSAIRDGFHDEWSKSLLTKTPGATERFAGIMQQGFVGAVYRMGSAWDAFLDKLANTGVLDTVTGAITNVTTAIGNLSQSNPRLLEFATYGILAAGILAPLGFAIAGIAAGAGVLIAIAGGFLRLTGALRLFNAIGGIAKGRLAALGIGGAAGGLGALAAAGAGAMTAKQAGAALSRMGSLTASGKMISGMSSAGAAAGVAGKAGFLGRLGARFIPGLGLVLMGGGAAYSAYDAWSRGDGAGGIAKSAALGAVGMDFSSAQAAEVEGAPQDGGSAVAQVDDAWSRGEGANEIAKSAALGADGMDFSSAQAADGEAAPQDGGSAIAHAQQTANEIRAAMQIDLTEAGRQAMETFAQGIAAGGAAAVAAASSVAARVRSAAQAPVQLNTGPNMQPAR